MTVADSELRAGLDAALGVRRWVAEVAGIAPFQSLDELLDAARTAATPLSPSEIDEALAQHPRIGEKASGGAAAAHSAREQSAPDQDDAELAAALAAGNAAYEARFGRVFLIRAAGRTRAEVLAELTRRLGLADEDELRIVGEQLREIAMLRLATTFGPTASGGEA